MPKKSSFKQVNTRVRPIVDEHGHIDHGPVTLYLDSRKDVDFFFNIPDYVCMALGCNETARGITADDAESEYKKVIVQYSDWARTAKAEPVILLQIDGRGISPGKGMVIRLSDDFFSTFNADNGEGDKTGISIGYELAFRVNGKIHWRQEKYDFDDPDKKTESVGGLMHRPTGIVLNYTPELHQKIDQIISAVNNAVIAMDGILNSKDVANSLMNSAVLLLAPKKEK